MMVPMRPTLPNLAACAVLLLFAFAPASAAGAKRVTNASAVRLRASAGTSAAVVDTLGVGVVLDELGRSDATQKINGVDAYWYKVSTPSGEQGWIFGGFTTPVVNGKVEDALLAVARDRTDNEVELLTFAEWTDLVAFLGRASAAASTPDAAAELELLRLSATQSALARVPIDQQGAPPYKPFLDSLGDSAVYSEPAGVWLVTADSYWKLRDRYAKLPIAERVAWDAANAPLPGECEGDLSCDLGAYAITDARYLELYPSGPHVDDALNLLVEMLKPVVAPGSKEDAEVYTIPTEEYRADMRKDVAKVRAAVAASKGAKRDEALRLLDALSAKIK